MRTSMSNLAMFSNLNPVTPTPIKNSLLLWETVISHHRAIFRRDVIETEFASKHGCA
jgi:hypothetical protein